MRDTELKPKDVPIISEYVEVFPKELQGLPSGGRFPSYRANAWISMKIQGALPYSTG